jgi:hypothetical protein
MNAWNYFDESLLSTEGPASAASSAATNAGEPRETIHTGVSRRAARARRFPRAADVKGWRASFITL